MLKYIYTLLFIFSFTLVLAKEQSIEQTKAKWRTKSNTDSNKLNLYEEIIDYYNTIDIDSANYFLKLGFEYAEETKSDRAKATFYLSEGKIYETHGQLVEARTSLLKALELFYHVDNKTGIANTYNGLGVVEAKQANYKQATSYFLRALNINEKIKDTAGIIQTYTSLGVVNTHLENFDKSAKYLYKALSLLKDTNTLSYCNVVNNIATLYAMQGDFNKALTFFNKCYVVSMKLNKPSLSTTVATNIANCYSNLGEINKALKFYNESLAICIKHDIPEEQARVIYNIALLYENTNPKLCINYMQQAIDIATKINNRYLLLEIYQSLYLVKKASADYQGACKALEKYHSLNDSVLSIENKGQIELLQSNFELEKSKSEIKELELNSQKQGLQTTIAILLIIAILSILAVVGYASYKRNKLNKALRHSLLVRDKLLSIIAHDLKSPINNVLSLLFELENNELSQHDKQMLLDILKKQTQLSLVTLDNILTWGQAQIREVKSNPEHFEVYDIVKNNIDLFNVNLTQKNIKVNVDFDKTIKANTDKDQFDFVIRNLLSNAIKFSKHDSEIHIKLSVLDNKLLRICIADEGLGMNADTLQSLFGVNPRVNYGTDKEKGSGLGLILCKEFVEANQGTIWAESIVNEGTVMCFTCKAV